MKILMQPIVGTNAVRPYGCLVIIYVNSADDYSTVLQKNIKFVPINMHKTYYNVFID